MIYCGHFFVDRCRDCLLYFRICAALLFEVGAFFNDGVQARLGLCDLIVKRACFAFGQGQCVERCLASRVRFTLRGEDGVNFLHPVLEFFVDASLGVFLF